MTHPFHAAHVPLTPAHASRTNAPARDASTTKRSRKPETLAQQVGRVSVELAQGLVQDWPTSFDNVRGAVIYAVYAELARVQGQVAPSLEQVEPAIPTVAANLLRLRIAALLPLERIDPYLFGCVHETLSGYQLVEGEVVASHARRKNGVHFTPSELADKVVRRTLEPLLKALSPSATVLDLRVCDSSVGAGAFLISLVRQLAPRVLLLGLAADLDEAKRLIAIHVVRGVDKCPFAIYATKLALRLECKADRMPGDWLDANIRLGDALVGLDRDQFVRFDARRKAPEQPVLAKLWDEAVEVGAHARATHLAKLDACARSR